MEWPAHLPIVGVGGVSCLTSEKHKFSKIQKVEKYF